jgi:hypothetical protein
MTSLPFGEFIKSKAGSTFTGEITPSRDNAAFERWTEVAYTTWVEDTDGMLLQLQTLIQKFADLGSPEIVSWLKRKVDRAKNIKYKPVATDEL